MKRLALLFLFTFITLHIQAQTARVKPIDSNLWGFINTKGEIIIEPAFRGCGPFSPEGLAPIYVPGNNTHYIIGLDGKRLECSVKTFAHNNVLGPGVKEGFVNGLAKVKVDGQWGYMNPSGNMVIQPTFRFATHFDKGFAIGKKKEGVFVISNSGTETLVDLEEIQNAKPFSEGLAPIRIDGKYGYVNSEAKLVIDSKFKSVGPFSNGLAWAKNENDKTGYIDQTGKWVIDPIYQLGNDFSEGFARVNKSDKWMLIDLKGQEFKVDQATKFGDFHEGLCYGRVGPLAGFLNPKLEWAIEPTFEEVRDFSFGLAPVKIDGKWGFIDTTGKIVIEAQFAEVKNFTASGN